MTDDTFQVTDFLAELNGGAFAEAVTQAVKDVALGTGSWGENGKQGKVTVELSMSNKDMGTLITVKHTIKTTTPTKRGKRTNEETTETVCRVGPLGVLEIVNTPDPQSQASEGGESPVSMAASNW